MNAAEVIARIKPLEPTLRARGMEALYLFGSVARGEATPDSDVDLMCELDDARRLSLIDLAEFGLALEAATCRPVDLLTRRSLRPGIRARAESEMMRVF